MPLIQLDLVIACTLMLMVITSLAAGAHARNLARDEAAKHGAGVWRVNPKTGEKRWIWLNYEQATGWVEDMNRGARKPVDVEKYMHDELGRK